MHSNPDINFEFQKTTTEKLEKNMNKINIKKATGFAAQLTDSINLSVDSGVFPDRLKQAQVSPIY